MEEEQEEGPPAPPTAACLTPLWNAVFSDLTIVPSRLICQAASQKDSLLVAWLLEHLLQRKQDPREPNFIRKKTEFIHMKPPVRGVLKCMGLSLRLCKLNLLSILMIIRGQLEERV